MGDRTRRISLSNIIAAASEKPNKQQPDTRTTTEGQEMTRTKYIPQHKQETGKDQMTKSAGRRNNYT
jgi:hypothetical protein